MACAANCYVRWLQNDQNHNIFKMLEIRIIFYVVIYEYCYKRIHLYNIPHIATR